MTTLLILFQGASALLFVVLMAVQTDKAEQGGVMGIGAQGGRLNGAIDMPVGAERILKPLSKWTAVAFLFLSCLTAISGNTHNLTIWHILVSLAIYLGVMLYGNPIWDAIVHIFGGTSSSS